MKIGGLTCHPLQRLVNIHLGSITAIIGLTIPAALFIGLHMGIDVVPGLEIEEAILLTVTLIVAMLTFQSARTNVLRGVVYLVLLFVYVILNFD